MIKVSTGAVAPYASVDFSVLEPVRLELEDELFRQMARYLANLCEVNKVRVKLPSTADLRHKATELLYSYKAGNFKEILSHPSISVRDLSLALASDLLPSEALFDNQTIDAGQFTQQTPRLAYVRQFRQHLLYGSVVPGPIEVVQSLAPGEKIEVLLEESTSRTFDTQIEEESQQSIESETSKTSSTELADSIQRTLSAVSTTRVGAEGGVNFAVWSAGASAEFTTSTSDITAAQKASKFSQQITNRQSEKLQKRTKISTRSIEQTSSLSSTRRILENKTDRLLQYGFRRLNYEVVSKVQDLGHELALIFEVDNPGSFLAKAEFSDAFPTLPADSVSIPKRLSQLVQVQVPFVGDWTLSYKGQISTLLGITQDQFLEFRHTASVSDIEVDVRSGRNDWQEGPSIGLDGSIVASFRSDSSKPKHPVFILSFRVSITVQEKVALPKSISDLIQKYGKGQPELVGLVSRYSLRRRRHADGLFEEELAVLIASAVNQILAAKALGPAQTVASVCQVLDESLDLSAAIYVLPRVGTVDSSNVLTDRSDSRYMIPSDSTDTNPAPMGSSIGWTRVTDSDDARSRFINAPFARLAIPIRPQHLELALSLVGLNRSTKRVAELLRRKRRLDAAKARVAREDLAPSTRNLIHSLEPTSEIRPWLDAENEPVEWPNWQSVYPIVSAQNVRIPVDGFAHEELKLGQEDSGDSRKRPWWCFL